MRVNHLKCRDDGENICITWAWPQSIEHVYINGKLFTLQEYKKRGGCIQRKIPGVSTYYISADDIYNEQDENKVTYIYKTAINLSVAEKIGKYKNHEIKLSAEHDVPADTVCYVKNENGIVYTIGEPLEAQKPITRIIRTELNEKLRFFISEKKEELFTLLIEHDA